MAKPVRLRQLATSDLEKASEHYRHQAGEPTALDVIGFVERAIGRIGRSPKIGSLMFAYELARADLRAWPLSRFPIIVFYIDAADIFDVWRILHAHRDVPATLRQPDP